MGEGIEYYEIRLMVSCNNASDNSNRNYRANIYISGNNLELACAKKAHPLKNIETEVKKIDKESFEKAKKKKGDIFWVE